MNFNNFIKLIIIEVMNNDAALKEYADSNKDSRIDVLLSKLIVFPHPRTENVLKRIEESNEPVNIDIPINEYHYGFVSSESMSILNMFSENSENDYGYSPDNVRRLIREATELNRYDAYSNMSKIAKNIRLTDSSIKVRTWDDITVNLEISDLVKVKLEIEMNNALFHMSDDSEDIISFIKDNQEDFVMTSALLNTLKISDYMATLNARKREVISFLSSDHMRTRMNRYLSAASVNLDEIINTSSNIAFSKRPYIAFKKSLAMFAAYLKIYPDITCRPGYSVLNLPTMSNFMNGMLHGYAVGDTLGAVLQRAQSSLIKDTHLISVLMQVMYRASLNNMELFDAVAELNDMVITDASVNMVLRGNVIGNERVMAAEADPSEKREKVEFNIRENATMQDFIDGNIDASAIGDYCAMYLSESINDPTEKEEKMGRLESIKYKARNFNIDRKRKKYHLLLNEISKDISLVESGTTELLTVIEKNNLIRKAHALKAEIIKTRENAKSLEDEDLMELIDERINYVDAVIVKIQGRNVRQERKGISFHLEKDMTDVLRASQGRSSSGNNDTYE